MSPPSRTPPGTSPEPSASAWKPDSTGTRDGLFLPFLSVGAVGIISVIAHAASGPMRDLATAFDHGDIHQAQRLAVQLAPLVEALNGNGFQAVMAKASLHVRGLLDDTSMRLPNVGPGPDEIARAEAGMRASGLL